MGTNAFAGSALTFMFVGTCNITCGVARCHGIGRNGKLKWWRRRNESCVSCHLPGNARAGTNNNDLGVGAAVENSV